MTLHTAIALSAALLLPLAACSNPAGHSADTGEEDAPAHDASDEDTADGPPEFQARSISGRWLAGDFHVHATGASNDADEASTPERIKEVAVERGLDFVVLTDHSNSTGSDTTTTEEDPALFNQGPDFPYWAKAAELSDASFLMVDGNEISPVTEGESGPTGHIGCYPRSLETFDPEIAFRDRPRGEVTGGEALEQALDAGCFATVNHPIALASWISWDWTARSYDALEVWNGGAGWDTGDVDARDAWACDLSQGRSVLAIGGSDNHKIEIEPPGDLLNPPIGQPITYVWADALSWPAIVEALDARRVTLSDTGAALEIDAHAADGSWLGMIGDTVPADQLRWLRVRGQSGDAGDEPRMLRVYRIVGEGCDDTRQEGIVEAPNPGMEVLFEQRVDAGERLELAVSVELAAGDAAFAMIEPRRDGVMQLEVAMTNAIGAQ